MVLYNGCLKKAVLVSISIFAYSSVYALPKDAVAENSQAKSNSQIMVVISGASGEIQKTNHNYSLSMDLNNIKQIIVYAVRPNRMVSYVQKGTLKQIWSGKSIENNYVKNPPNAVLSSQNARPAVVTLTQMALKGDHVSFQFKPIQEGMFTIPTGHVLKVVLTVDAASNFTAGQLTDTNTITQQKSGAYTMAANEQGKALKEGIQEQMEEKKADAQKEADDVEENGKPDNTEDGIELTEMSTKDSSDQIKDSDENDGEEEASNGDNANELDLSNLKAPDDLGDSADAAKSDASDADELIDDGLEDGADMTELGTMEVVEATGVAAETTEAGTEVLEILAGAAGAIVGE